MFLSQCLNFLLSNNIFAFTQTTSPSPNTLLQTLFFSNMYMITDTAPLKRLEKEMHNVLHGNQ